MVKEESSERFDERSIEGRKSHYKKLAEYLKKIQRVELKNRITQKYSVSNTEICIRTKKN